jgi:ribosome maturation factor RimP
MPGGLKQEPEVGGMGQHHGRPAGGRSTGVAVPRRSGADMSALRGQLTAVVAPVVAKAGFELEDLGITRVGRRHLLRVVVDADGGVSLDAVAEVSRQVSEALDAAEAGGGELIAGEYQLEVSSPGVDRPLTEPRHWRRNVGRLVKVKAGERHVVGRVTAADAAGVMLDVDGVTTAVAYDRLGPGRVQVEFVRPGEADSDDADIDDADIDEEEGADEE